jgi:hypothetical protein
MKAITQHGATEALRYLPSNLVIPADDHRSWLLVAADLLSAKAQQVGVTPLISNDFNELLLVNQRARAAGTWDAIIRTVDPRFRRLDASNAFWVRGVAASGDVVSVQAAALFDCFDRSFGERFEDLSLFYDDAREAPADEVASCISPVANDTRGSVVWMLAGWTRPDYRGRGLLSLLNRVGKLHSWCRWRPDCFAGVAEPDIVPTWSTRKIGDRYMDPEPCIHWNMPENGRTILHFIRWEPVHFWTDIHQIMKPVSN